ncbi:hypothetical protein ACJZ2D_011756 [Fusarium nematophilum]
MDPLSIVGASLALASAIAKTSMTLTRFSSDFRDCADDLGRISLELQAIAAILDPLTRALSRSLRRGLPDTLFEQVDSTLVGCVSAVGQIEEHMLKYRNDKVWTKAKWALFGQEDMQKLRESLEVYKMALSIGLQAISLDLGQDIRDDTENLRAQVEEVRLNTDEILARISSIRRTSPKAAEVDPQSVDRGVERDSKAAESRSGPGMSPRIPETLEEESGPDSVASEDSPTARTGSPVESEKSWGLISFKGIEDLAERIKAVVEKALPNRQFIETSQRQRALLNKTQKRKLDAELANIPRSTNSAFVKDILARGADPNGLQEPLAQRPLAKALKSPNNPCLFALLQYGADPNAAVEVTDGMRSSSSYQPALAYAAWSGNQSAVWALRAAGAAINPPSSDVNCPRCTQSRIRVCTTPLLRAIDSNRHEGTAKTRMVRFLLANGADPNYFGCDHVGKTHRLRSPLSAAIVWPAADEYTSLAIARLLFEAGAELNWERLPVSDGAIDDENPIHTAAKFKDAQLLALMVNLVKPSDSKYWKRAVSCAAKAQAWSCIETLLCRPYWQEDYIHYLVDDYMSSRAKIDPDYLDLDWSSFYQAATLILGNVNNSNPSRQTDFTYRRKKLFGDYREVTEVVSAFDLVARIPTKKSRGEVRRLLASWRYILQGDGSEPGRHRVYDKDGLKN